MQQKKSYVFFFNDTATTEIYTLSLHDALPISPGARPAPCSLVSCGARATSPSRAWATRSPYRRRPTRSEEHTSELQSRLHLVCRLLLEKKKKYDSLNDDSLHSTDQGGCSYATS